MGGAGGGGLGLTGFGLFPTFNFMGLQSSSQGEFNRNTWLLHVVLLRCIKDSLKNDKLYMLCFLLTSCCCPWLFKHWVALSTRSQLIKRWIMLSTG